MIYYWFSREKFVENAWDKYHIKGGKEKATNFYAASHELLNQETSNKDRILSQ